LRTIMHLTASTLYGGPERQMCYLARSLPSEYRSVFASFSEKGRCRAFLDEVGRQGFEAVQLQADTPHLVAACREFKDHLRRLQPDVLLCHGYKANLVGRPAARKLDLPVAAVSRGWMGSSVKVRFYEMLDRLCLRRMDRVVCVSEGQADKVRQAGVPENQLVVIRNAIRPERFARPDSSYRDKLHGFFGQPRSRIIGAAGRLTPEKGFTHLITAAAHLLKQEPFLGFVLFGEGPLRKKLEKQIAAAHLSERFIVAGFRDDLDSFMPFLDLLVLPSYAEGLPNVVLEAFAAGVPVVATAIVGTPEVVEDGVNGYLVPPGDVKLLQKRILDVLRSEPERKAMGLRGRGKVRREFTFEAQSDQYQRLFDELLASPPPGTRHPPPINVSAAL
jgi:glycosyltransferase involved in cell wall biosynthesis